MRISTLNRLVAIEQATGLPAPGGLDQQSAPLVPLPDQIAALVGIDTPDAVGLPTDLAGLRSLIRTILGQPQMPSGQWRMSAYQNATRIDAALLRIEALEQINAIQQQINTQLLAGATATSSQMVALNARLDLVQAFAQATQLELARNSAADAATLGRLSQVESQQHADALADIARDAHEANQDAQLEAQRLRAVAGEQASAEIRAAAQAAQARAEAAQARAEQAINAAAAAQSKANADELAAQQAQATATAAQQAAATNATALAAVQAEVLKRLPAGMVKRFTIATPAVSLAVGTPTPFLVTLPVSENSPAFTDNNYFVFFTKASGSTLLNVQLSDLASSKTATTFLATMQTTGALTVGVQASSAEVFVIHG